MPVESERLLFRPYTDDDFDFLMSLLTDPEMVRFIGNGETRNIYGGKNFLSWIYSTYKFGDNLGLLLLVRKEDNVLIGHAGLVPQVIENEVEIEIGYWIARDYWGQGYATEAAIALWKYGKEHLNKQRFIALIQPENVVSQKVAKNIGMVMEKKIILGGKSVNVFSIS
ncbi:GNAT family N-acetyltransferase [Viridibacillus sp. FSL H8-0123]|uniref:GNAT family N-acetyltransferase n=1 Tax=Viridibacillus sp. FSL H8-0123 TaxID=1928922 RepID=UPI0009F9AC42|nr:GNAT family N-acetyltransferase [Viridibacillus sp. FSL H8-0123]